MNTSSSTRFALTAVGLGVTLMLSACNVGDLIPSAAAADNGSLPLAQQPACMSTVPASIGGPMPDGDTVVIRRQDTANTGDIIVALIDDEEATLKRLRKRGSSIALEAANPAYETRVLGPDRVKIQGRLVNLFRRY